MTSLRIPHSELYLEPTSAAQLYARMCLNMLHHHQQANRVREVSDLLLAALPTDTLGRSMRAVVRQGFSPVIEIQDFISGTEGQPPGSLVLSKTISKPIQWFYKRFHQWHIQWTYVHLHISYAIVFMRCFTWTRPNYIATYRVALCRQQCPRQTSRRRWRTCSTWRGGNA